MGRRRRLGEPVIPDNLTPDQVSDLPTEGHHMTDDLPSHIDLDHIETVARATALALDRAEACYADLTPGDATIYHLLVVRPGVSVVSDGANHPYARRDEFVVTLLNLDGASYPWGGGPAHWAYEGDKLSRGHEHTSRVVAYFLTKLSEALQ